MGTVDKGAYPIHTDIIAVDDCVCSLTGVSNLNDFTGTTFQIQINLL